MWCLVSVASAAVCNAAVACCNTSLQMLRSVAGSMILIMLDFQFLENRDLTVSLSVSFIASLQILI